MIVEEIFEIVQRLNQDEGVSFLLAEQNAHLVLRCAHHGVVLENGRVVASGPAAELAARDDVSDFYLGGASTVPSPGSATASHSAVID
jgi:branched-chain amino acid transport system ATP-binding protein